MDAREAFESIKATGRKNTSFDWEAILANQYKAALVRPRTVVDVGANIGTHTQQFVEIARKVEAFEPIPQLSHLLRERFEGFPVTVHQVALSNRTGRSEFHYKPELPGHSGFKNTHSYVDTKIEIINVDTRSLDSFHFSAVDFIKLDCEGAEPMVIEGAHETIRINQPLIAVEYGEIGYSAYGFEKDELWRLAKRAGYFVTDLFGNIFHTRDDYERCVDAYYWDFFMVPARDYALQNRLMRNGLDVLRSLLADGQFSL